MRKAFALLFISASFLSHAESKFLNWCASILPHHNSQDVTNYPYAPTNFPPALRAEILGYDIKSYQDFARTQAAQLAAQFFDHSPGAIFDELSNSYSKFLLSTGKKQSNVYNRLGSNKDPHLYNFLGDSSPPTPNDSAIETFAKKLFALSEGNIEKSYREKNGESPFIESHYYKGQWHSSASPKYRTLHGEEISAGAILREDNYKIADDKTSELTKSKLQLRSCYPKEGRIIMKDVFARIDKLKNKSWEEAKLDYAVAMRGFFISTPLYSGTAGIGRIYFSALASRLSGKAVTLPADIDIHAMTLNEADFTNWMTNEVDIF